MNKNTYPQDKNGWLRSVPANKNTKAERLPACRSKAERKKERLSWAIWAAKAVADVRTAERDIRTVADIPEDFQLLQDSQDVSATLEHIGISPEDSEYGCLFAQVQDGDYVTVYGCNHFVPLLTARVYKLL